MWRWQSQKRSQRFVEFCDQLDYDWDDHRAVIVG
jgi:hypothetical protein